MIFAYYDIESFNNIFTLALFFEKSKILEIYHLLDPTPGIHLTPALLENTKRRIKAANKNFDAPEENIFFFDLHERESNERLAQWIGISDADPRNHTTSSFPKCFEPTADVHPYFDETVMPYFVGYNSKNYDTTMLAAYYDECFFFDGHTRKFQTTSAEVMRRVNDRLFSDQFKSNMPQYLLYRDDPRLNVPLTGNKDYAQKKNRIRSNMLLSGRLLDLAEVNEKQKKVALKRLLGMIGAQILESEQLSQNQIMIETEEQFMDLIAYNVSDVVQLGLRLAHDSYYQSQIMIKKQLLDTYPELIYDKLPNQYAPDKRLECIRSDRLCIDSSSANFVEKVLCPYGHLNDIRAVSFNYPDPVLAEKFGIESRNILDETRTFFYSLYPQPELRQKFDVIYNYYKSIEGKNFNDSQAYLDFYQKNALPVSSTNNLEPVNTCLCYFDHDGNPTSCFVNFSIGGIHGAEYNKALYEYDINEFQKLADQFEQCKALYPDPRDLKKAKHVTIGETTFPAGKFLKAGSTLKKAEYKNIESKRPQLFVKSPSGNYNIHPRYVYTSVDLANHEDFTSYYPNLLRMMAAFVNESLGEDRYATLFEQKQDYGRKMKDKTLSEEDRAFYKNAREGVKLLLNAASGKADAKFKSNIQMNNRIISMRIIGQLFSYHIGQAQAFEGAKLTSTNTDGLYSVMDKETNNAILERESASIHVDIEPEELFLISKDSNNRLEIDCKTGKIISASGGTLACGPKGPMVTKALAHPAIVDWALCEYLVMAGTESSGSTNAPTSIDAPFNRDLGRNILLSAKKRFDTPEYLRRFQNIIASSDGSQTYHFAKTSPDSKDPIILQHYNRVFYLKDNTPNALYLCSACVRVITPAVEKKRRKEDPGASIQRNDPLALNVLSHYGISDAPANKEMVLKKLSNIELDWPVCIQNKDLSQLSPAELQYLEDNMDIEKYLDLLENCFNRNWRNEGVPDHV